ncbi:hypothetical protein [Pseudomonas sp. W5-36]|uniref:hypothetical protein n=1 Tax=Pseudomonas sp. W5-36 TaxID=3097455 RepID=UPI00397CFD7E
MSQHLRFDASTGTMVTRTLFGQHTEDLLQLNDKALVEYRNTTLHTLKIASIALDSLKLQKSELSDFLRQGKISQPIFDREILDIEKEYAKTEKVIESLTGKTALPPLVKVRLGVALI